MNSISTPRDDHGLIEFHAQRAQRGLVPKTVAVRQFPATDPRARPDLPPHPHRPRADTVRHEPERRKRRVPVLLDTRATSGRTIDLTA